MKTMGWPGRQCRSPSCMADSNSFPSHKARSGKNRPETKQFRVCVLTFPSSHPPILPWLFGTCIQQCDLHLLHAFAITRDLETLPQPRMNVKNQPKGQFFWGTNIYNSCHDDGKSTCFFSAGDSPGRGFCQTLPTSSQGKGCQVNVK